MLRPPVCTLFGHRRDAGSFVWPVRCGRPAASSSRKSPTPVWKPVDFQLFSAPATPFDAEFGHVYDTLLP